MSRPRLAVIGVGHLGTRHAEKLSRIAQADLIAVCDTHTERAAEVAAANGCRTVRDYRQLTDQVDAVVIATPTATHAEVANHFLTHGVHCLVEKPITSDCASAEELVALSRKMDLRLAVGHVERFNPAMVALNQLELAPRFVECYRISPFRFRSLDIGVVHDLMIHDLDIILHLIPHPVASIEAFGVGVFGQCEDIANARISFTDGSVATATASRVSIKSERKIRIFADETYVTLDFEQRSGRILRKGEKLRRGEVDPKTIDPTTLDNPMAFILSNLIEMQNLQVVEGDALEAEDTDFVLSVRDGRDPSVTGEHGLRALKVAEQVVAGVERSLEAARGAAS